MNGHSRVVRLAAGALVMLGLIAGRGRGEANQRTAVRGPGAPVLQAEAVELNAPEVSLPLELNRGLPIVMLSVNGKGPFRFILDTGAAGSLVSESLTKEANLAVLGEAMVSSPARGAPIPAKAVRIDIAEIGEARIKGLQAVSMDTSRLFQDPGAPRGVLSPAVFAGYLLTLDYPGARITLRRGALETPDGAEVFEYAASDRLPAIPISVAGVDLKAHLDSGAPAGITVPKSLMPKLPLTGEPTEKARMRTVDAEVVVLGATLKGDARIGRFVLESPEVRFSDLPAAHVGFELLRNFAVTVDVANHRLRLTEGTAAVPEP